MYIGRGRTVCPLWEVVHSSECPLSEVPLYIPPQLISTQSPKMIQGEAYKELEEEHSVTLRKLQAVQIEKEQLLQSSHDVTAQLRAAQQEGEDLGAELERVKEELATAKSSAG